MKSTTMFSISSILSLFFIFNSCTIQGEEVCGIWNATGDYGKMKIEITPWDGKFVGYLLEYENNGKKIKGEKTEDYIFLTDLVYKDGKYENGKIYFDPDSEDYCNINLELLNSTQLKAIYNCEGHDSEEIWTTKGAATVVNTETKTESTEPVTETKSIEKTVVKKNTEKNIEKVEKTKVKGKEKSKSVSSKINTTESASTQDETKKKSAFYVIGVHKTVSYNDMKTLGKAVEDLWTETYTNDFSGRLNNISDQENMYAVYSNYENQKGTMTITIGYKVKDLSNVPTGLNGATIPTNDFLVYPMSGTAADYEGEGWEELYEMMGYRKTDSADFEIYSFDSNYEIKNAEMWIATK